MLIAVAAMTSNRLIGKNNTLPRHLPADLKKFKELTMGHTVIMWRKTYESLPESFRPLPWRHNIILSHSLISPLIKGGWGDQINDKKNTSLEYVSSLDNFLSAHKNDKEDIFIIWWSQIYTALLPHCDRLYITEVKWNYEGDTYFPEFKDIFVETSREYHDTHDFVTYERVIARNEAIY